MVVFCRELTLFRETVPRGSWNSWWRAPSNYQKQKLNTLSWRQNLARGGGAKSIPMRLQLLNKTTHFLQKFGGGSTLRVNRL